MDQNMQPTPEMSNNTPPTPQTPQTPQNNNMAIAALVCGILGIIGSWIPIVCYFTFILAILGIVFGAKGMKIAEASGVGKGLAVGGLVCGILGTVSGALGIVCVVCALIAAGVAAGAEGNAL